MQNYSVGKESFFKKGGGGTIAYIFATKFYRLSCILEKRSNVDWLQSLKQFFINVSYHILVASLTLMALF